MSLSSTRSIKIKPHIDLEDCIGNEHRIYVNGDGLAEGVGANRSNTHEIDYDLRKIFPRIDNRGDRFEISRAPTVEQQEALKVLALQWEAELALQVRTDSEYQELQRQREEGQRREPGVRKS